jgi:hypothetical protein
VIGPPDVLPPPEPLLEPEDAQAARTTAAAQVAADLMIVECFTLVLHLFGASRPAVSDLKLA